MHCATHYIILLWFAAAWHWGGVHRKTHTLNAMGCMAMRAQRNTMPLQGRVLMYCATHYIISPWFTAAWHWGGARRKTYDKRHGVHSHACPKRLPPNPEAPPKPSPALRATLRSPRPHPRLLVLLSLSPLENIHGALLARAAFVRGPRVCPAAAPSPIPAAGTTHCGATGSSFTLI